MKSLHLFILFLSIKNVELLNCGPGYYSGGSGCRGCLAGTYKQNSGNSISLCLACPPGAYCPYPIAASYNLCPAGSYNPYSKQQSCIPCGQGSFSSTAGLSVPCTSACPAGWTTAQGGNVDTSKCTIPCGVGTGGPGCATCAAGKFAPFQGKSACQTCPFGTGSIPGDIQCLSCSSDSACKTSDLRPCVPCASACTVCAAGSYNDASVPHFTNCSAGTYSTIVQAVSSDTCSQCDSGKTTRPIDTGVTTCISCAALNQTYPLNALFSSSVDDPLVCAWVCKPGYISINASEATFKISSYPNYTVTEARSIFHIQNDYCCDPTLTGVGTYLSGCSRKFDGVVKSCPPLLNGYYVDSDTPKINHCDDWACDANAYNNGTACILQPICQANYTYLRDTAGGLVSPPFSQYTCVPCS